MLLKQKRGKRKREKNRDRDRDRDRDREEIEREPLSIDLHFSAGFFDFGSFCSRANDISPVPCSRRKNIKILSNRKLRSILFGSKII